MTFDYRGTGSRAEMKADTADVDRWFADVRAILDAVADSAWSGQATSLSPGSVTASAARCVPFVEHTRLASVITVTAGDGYWRRNQPGVRWLAPVLWSLIAPVAIRVTGYYPGRQLKVLGDVPGGAMRQWARWCLHPDYLQRDHPEAPALFAGGRRRR